MKRTIKEVYDLIKEKIERGKKKTEEDIKKLDTHSASNSMGMTRAYQDILSLIESSHLLEEDKPIKGSGLEAYKEIVKMDLHNYLPRSKEVDYIKSLKTIEKELERLQELDNAIPMEMNDIEEVRKFANWYFNNDYKKLKAFEIIVSMFDIELDFHKEGESSVVSFYAKGKTGMAGAWSISYDKAQALMEGFYENR